jgi:hypothetical protein
MTSSYCRKVPSQSYDVGHRPVIDDDVVSKRPCFDLREKPLRGIVTNLPSVTGKNPLNKPAFEGG